MRRRHVAHHRDVQPHVEQPHAEPPHLQALASQPVQNDPVGLLDQPAGMLDRMVIEPRHHGAEFVEGLGVGVGHRSLLSSLSP